MPMAVLLASGALKRLHATEAEVKKQCAVNAKQRFALDPTTNCVRAVQGHSVPVSTALLMRALTMAQAPMYALHGTTRQYYDSIARLGLKAGGLGGAYKWVMKYSYPKL